MRLGRFVAGSMFDLNCGRIIGFDCKVCRHESLGELQAENYRSWIRQNSERTEFWRIQLRIDVSSFPPLALREMNLLVLAKVLDECRALEKTRASVQQLIER